MKILVTGGAGFIGSALVDEYVQQGHSVLAYDNLEQGKKKNVNPGAKFVLGDILEPAFFDAVRSFEPDVISHHAGLANIEQSFQDAVRYLSVNFHGTLNVAIAAEKYGVKRIIFGSSSSPLHQPDGEEKTEEVMPAPRTPYGVYVAASEMILKSYETRGVQSVALRYSNVYGPRQDPYTGGVVAAFTERLLKGQMVIIYGSGWQRRDFVHISDVVRANLSALDLGENESIHICTGTETSVRSVYQLLSHMAGKGGEILFQNGGQGETNSPPLSNRKAWDILGWSPAVTLEEGLAGVVDYFMEETTIF